MGNFRELNVWKKSHEMVLSVYRMTSEFPKSETYSLVDQMRRCAVSIPANIAEGSGNGHGKNYCRYLDIAYSSSCELSYYLDLSKDLEYLDLQSYSEKLEMLDHIQRMIKNLIKSQKS